MTGHEVLRQLLPPEVEVPTSFDWSDEGDSATVSEEEQRVWVSDGDSVSVRDPIGILDDYSLEAEDYI